VLVDLDNVDAVFKSVLLAYCLPGQFALLTDWDKAAAEPVSHGATDDETTCLDTGNGVHFLACKGTPQRLDRFPEAGSIAQQRRHIAENDTRLRIVGYRTDQPLQFVHTSLLVKFEAQNSSIRTETIERIAH